MIKQLKGKLYHPISNFDRTAYEKIRLDMVLHLFNITPHHDLNLMRHGQTITGITNGVLQGMGQVLAGEKPDLVLVHGDTTTTFAAALAAFMRRFLWAMWRPACAPVIFIPPGRKR